MYINHITLNTGHLARSQRADVAPEVTALLAPWLQGIINTGKTAPLPVPALSQYSALALMEGGGLVVTLYGPAGPHESGKPHGGDLMPLVTMGIAQRSRQAAPLWQALCKAYPGADRLTMPVVPWAAVITYPTMAAHRSSVEWLGDLERCIAWAWLTRNPDLRPVP